MLKPKQVQGNVSMGSGMPKQIVRPKVGFVDKMFDSGAPVYKLTKPSPDQRLHRPGYTNNVSVLIDLAGQEFLFPAPLEFQPHSTDLDIAHSVLEGMRNGAKAGGNFAPERPAVDELGFMLKQNAKQRALEDVAAKMRKLLKEGYSVEEIEAIVGPDRDRAARRAELPSEMAMLLERDIHPGGGEVGEGGPSEGVGVVALGQGIRTVPALSVPFMLARPNAGAGSTDSMGRVVNTGARSQGFVALKAPTTGSSDFSLSHGFSGRSLGAPASMRSAISGSDAGASDVRSRASSSMAGSAYLGAFGSVGGTPVPSEASRMGDILRASAQRRGAQAFFRRGKGGGGGGGGGA